MNLYSSEIDIFIGSSIHDKLIKALEEEVKMQLDKDILINLGCIEIFYSELV